MFFKIYFKFIHKCLIMAFLVSAIICCGEGKKSSIQNTTTDESLQSAKKFITHIHNGFIYNYAPIENAIPLPNEAVNFMRKEAKKLAAKNEGVSIKVHTDNAGEGIYLYNKGVEIAKYVKGIFMDEGVNENEIFISSMGASQPTASNETDLGRAENRRIEVYYSNSK